MKHLGILTFHNACNFGAVLQAYALKEALGELCGTQVDVLNYHNRDIQMSYSPFGHFDQAQSKVKELLRTVACFPFNVCRNRLFAEFRKNKLGITGPVLRKEDLKETDCDIYITGSDQVWNFEITNEDTTFFLDFVDESKKCYSYGASIGQSEFSDEEVSRLSSLMNRMDAISFREEELVSVFSPKLPEKQIVSVLDPVFLLPVERWREMKTTLNRKPYVLFFAVGNNPQLLPVMEYAVKLAQERGIEALLLSDQDVWYKFRLMKHYGPASPETFLALIDNADCVVTNSFHATAFAVQFHKELFVETGLKRNGRLLNLLKIAGLEDRMLIKGKETVENKSAIDWDRVDAALETKRQDSVRYIQKILNSKG